MYFRYLAVLLGLCAAVLAGGLLLALRLEPLTGDLTRIGGYSEYEFGWNGIEEQFTPPLARPGTLDGDDPIVVIGDSYSRNNGGRQTRDGAYWVDFLANETGLRVGVFGVDDVPVERLVAAAANRRNPPRLVILELAERWLKKRLAGTAACPAAAPPVEARLDRMADPLAPGGYRRRLRPRSIETAASEVTDYVKKTVWRSLFPQDGAPVLRLPLARSDLFSSRRPGELLIYADDLEKARWSDDDWANMRCRLLRYQQQVTANGATAFLFVVAPDKPTAYAQFLPPGPWQVNASERLADPARLNMPRLDIALRAAIAAGTRDVYLPDDTHWSTAGSRIVVEAVLRYLERGTPPAANGNSSASR